MAEEHVGENRPCGEEDPAEHKPGPPLRRDVEHGDEEAEEEQGGAEVALEDEHPERDGPDDEDGAEVAGTRQGYAKHLGAH